MTPAQRIGSWLAPLIKAEPQPQIQKGNTITNNGRPGDLFGLVFGSGLFHDVHALLAYRLYMKSDVLGTAIHRISNNLSSLTLGLTTDGQDFDADAEVIRFLNSSSEGYTARRFWYEITASYLLTNEAWVVLRGRPDRPPISRTWLYPFDVTETISSADGLPQHFHTTCKRDARTYNRVEQQGRLRWISQDGLNELVPILGAESVDRPFRGQSPIAPLYYSVNQNVEGKRHNSAVLTNGLRTTGVIQPPEGKQFEATIIEKLQKALQALRGAGTSGGTLILPHRVETIDLAISNQEMDYIEMLREAKESVYTFYNIPLPLVTNDASTFNNFATAQTAFFDGAIFPTFDDLADALKASLSFRFPELDNASITYNENTIRALKGRNIERMTKSRATGSLTTNEIREVGGYPPVTGGDEVLVQSTLVPVGDTMFGDIPTAPPPQLPDEPQPEDADDQRPAAESV